MATIDTHPEPSKLKDPSVVRIIKDLRDDVTALFRQEVALAKREMSGKAATFGRNAAFLGLGALVGLYAVLFFCLFLDNLLQAGLTAIGFPDPIAAWFAPLILGMLLGIGALLLSLKALKAMRKEKALPTRTLDSIREDKDWVKGKLKG
ncbi:MAG TPA: phage holin family protein [Fibrobacteria bacterium]|nr:phage holin family protein [Fibrobacteria bacterium]